MGDRRRARETDITKGGMPQNRRIRGRKKVGLPLVATGRTGICPSARRTKQNGARRLVHAALPRKSPPGSAWKRCWWFPGRPCVAWDAAPGGSYRTVVGNSVKSLREVLGTRKIADQIVLEMSGTFLRRDGVEAVSGSVCSQWLEFIGFGQMLLYRPPGGLH